MKNIGSQLAEKLNAISIYTDEDLKAIGIVNVMIKLSSLENSNVCVNMFYALHGAIRNVRWHSFTKEEKHDLLHEYNSIKIMHRDFK